MDKKETYSEASDVSAEKGVVHVDGPDGVDVGLTPEAALETSNRLLEGASTAAGQRARAEDLLDRAWLTNPNKMRFLSCKIQTRTAAYGRARQPAATSGVRT
jgi:hypothetical protein